MKINAEETKLAVLAAMGGSLYSDHVTRRPTVIVVDGWEMACACQDAGPDQRCDVGVALARMRAADARRFDDGRRGR